MALSNKDKGKIITLENLETFLEECESIFASVAPIPGGTAIYHRWLLQPQLSAGSVFSAAWIRSM